MIIKPIKRDKNTQTVAENLSDHQLCESKWLLGLQSVSEVGSGWYLALDLLER